MAVDTYKLEKLKLQYDQERFYLGELERFLLNPIVEMIGAAVLIAYLTRGKQSTLEKLTGIDLQQVFATYGITAVIISQQLAPALPYLMDTAGSLLSKNIPKNLIA